MTDSEVIEELRAENEELKRGFHHAAQHAETARRERSYAWFAFWVMSLGVRSRPPKRA